MTAADKTRVLTLLVQHCGRNNGVAVALIAAYAEISEREVRHAITALREEGIAVCGHPKTGYFIAETPEELEETCAFLRSRALHSLTLESKLRHVPLPELLGQMRLKT